MQKEPKPIETRINTTNYRKSNSVIVDKCGVCETSTETSNQTESWHQRQLVQWCRQYEWGQYLYHIPNETTGGQGWIVRNRQMGCRKGVPDLCLPIPMQGYHGLYIELKTKTGRPSEQQKRWVRVLNELGYRAEICNGWEAARDLLMDYMEVER